MSKTVVFIQSHSEANELTARHFPYFELSGCDLVGIGREDTLCTWPKSDQLIATFNIGKEGYTEKGQLPERFVAMLELFIDYRFQSYLNHYDHLCIVENDGIFVRRLPDTPERDNGFTLYSTFVGGPFPGFNAPFPLHPPWWMSRALALEMARCGRRMLRCGLRENGFYDQFIGLLVGLYNIPTTPAPSWSCNLIDQPQYLQSARQAIQDPNVSYIHGIKTVQQLKDVTEGFNLL